MPTPYERLYENLLPKFRDYDIPDMTDDEVKDFLHDYLDPAIAEFHVCRKDLNDRDDLLQRFNCDLSVEEIEILSNYMLLEYLDSTYIRTPTLLKMNLSSSDFNAFSSANHLDKLIAMHDTHRKENDTLISRYSWMGVKNGDTSFGNGYKNNKNAFMGGDVS